MSKLTKFEIELNNPSGIYQAGTTISGKVHIVLNAPMEVRAIKLTLNGRVKTFCSTARSEGHVYRQDGKEDLFHEVITVWENPIVNEVSNPEVPSGIYEFPFFYALPPTCPSSFEGEFGSVRFGYSVVAGIERKWKFDEAIIKPIFVMAYVDLNADPNMAKPV